MNVKNLNNIKQAANAKGDNIRLNLDQLKALDEVKKWYHSSVTEHTLSGFAGTGKTYLIRYIIQEVINESCIITAPTHKALRVLEAGVGVKGKTLHSLLGLRPNIDLIDFDIENPQYAQKNDPSMQYYRVVILDECSMVGTKLYELIKYTAGICKTKILYCGDILQLPPVKEAISPTFANANSYSVLRTVVRQEEGHPLFELFPIIRKDIVDKTSNFIRHISTHRENVDGDKGYAVLGMPNFKAATVGLFDDPMFKQDIDFCRVLAWTNTCVSEANKYYRSVCMKGDKLPLVSYGDVFTSYITILDNFLNPIITNSEDYTINDCTPYITDDGIKVFVVTFRSLYDGKITTPFSIVDHTDIISFNRFVNLLDLLCYKALDGAKGGWFKYYNFKNRYLILNNVYLNKSRKKVKKDIDYGYGLTVHKSQGSTFFNAGLNLSDIVYINTPRGRELNDVTFRNRLIYVGLSRARDMVYIKY